jgi:hypothetical protein
MSDHESRGHHRDHASHSQREESPESRAQWRTVHRDWRLWEVVALMIPAMLVYVMTIDEVIQRGGKVGELIPAAPGP